MIITLDVITATTQPAGYLGYRSSSVSPHFSSTSFRKSPLVPMACLGFRVQGLGFREGAEVRAEVEGRRWRARGKAQQRRA